MQQGLFLRDSKLMQDEKQCGIYLLVTEIEGFSSTQTMYPLETLWPPHFRWVGI